MKANTTSSSMWSLDPLLYASLPEEVYKSVIGDIDIVRGMYIMLLVLPLIYILIHKVLLKFNTRYRGLSNTSSKQIVVLHHAVEALVLSMFLPINSFSIIKANFQIHTLHENMTNFRIVAILFIGISIMYAIEIASRLNNIRPMLFFHHVITFLDSTLVCLFPSSVMFKSASVLAYFICFEYLTFVGLFMYRIFPLSKITPKVIFLGIVLFGATRPLQLLWVGAAIFGSWNDDNNSKVLAVVQVIVTVALTSLQLWSLNIHVGIWKRSIRNVENGISPVINPASKIQSKAEKNEDETETMRSTQHFWHDNESGSCPKSKKESV